MRIAALVLVVMAGCGGSETVSSLPRDASGLYSISADGQTITVPGGALWFAEPASPPHTLESYARTCFVHDGKSLERAELVFRRPDAAAAWQFDRAHWFLGECH